MVNTISRRKNWFMYLGLAVLLFLMWYFYSLVAYIAISLVLAMVGRPLVRVFTQIKIRNFRVSDSIGALLTLVVMWLLFIGAFRFLIPTLVSEFQELSTINPAAVFDIIDRPLMRLFEVIGHEPVDSSQALFTDIFKNQLASHLGLAQLSNIVGVIVGALGELLMACFSISFITFFFLREEGMFKQIIVALLPDEYEDRVLRIIDSVYNLLRRYFAGLIAEVTLVGILVTTGLTIVGLGFSHAVVIGLVCGILNIIPYLGPWMGAAIGILIGIAVNIHADFSQHTLPLLGLMAVVFGAVQLVDNIIFQPLIYSNSVKAHPLEIFLVIMAAGSFGGIIGMILAIPVYTILRVIAKEFFNDWKLVKKITEGM
ncbi:MAG: AI-2E family transporter [Mangrovibacterium sp.]